jgi:hypothetical protein
MQAFLHFSGERRPAKLCIRHHHLASTTGGMAQQAKHGGHALAAVWALV